VDCTTQDESTFKWKKVRWEEYRISEDVTRKKE